MGKLVVTSKGQIILSEDQLKHLGVQPGQQITVEKLSNGRIEMKAVRRTGKISDAFGFLKKKSGKSLSIEDMNKITSGRG